MDERNKDLELSNTPFKLKFLGNGDVSLVGCSRKPVIWVRNHNCTFFLGNSETENNYKHCHPSLYFQQSNSYWMECEEKS